MIQLLVNGKSVAVAAPPDMPLLWVLRDKLGLTGTKYGCGAGLCGACTVLADDRAIRSCQVPASSLAGVKLVTVEGLPADSAVLRAWIELNVPQCGYCQSGQLLAATGLLRANFAPSDDDIDVAMAGVLCRCGTYVRVRSAIHRAAELNRRAP